MKNFKEYAKYYDLIYKHKPYKKEAEMVYRWAGKPKTIIDLGCGTGRHAQYWVKHSEVVGVEKSLEMLADAYYHDRVQYVNMDIENLQYFEKEFDCVTALFNVVGYIHLSRFIEHLPLKKGGCFIFDCWNYNKIKKDKPRIETSWIDKKYLRVVYPTESCTNCITLRILIIEKYKKMVSEFHKIHIYTPKEIKKICKGYKITGIKNTDTWNTWYRLERI